jgi:hypothetical protein
MATEQNSETISDKFNIGKIYIEETFAQYCDDDGGNSSNNKERVLVTGTSTKGKDGL